MRDLIKLMVGGQGEQDGPDGARVGGGRGPSPRYEDGDAIVCEGVEESPDAVFETRRWAAMRTSFGDSEHSAIYRRTLEATRKRMAK